MPDPCRLARHGKVVSCLRLSCIPPGQRERRPDTACGSRSYRWPHATTDQVGHQRRDALELPLGIGTRSPRPDHWHSRIHRDQHRTLGKHPHCAPRQNIPTPGSADCCDAAAIGHPVTPSPAMNSRRRIRDLRGSCANVPRTEQPAAIGQYCTKLLRRGRQLLADIVAKVPKYLAAIFSNETGLPMLAD